MKLWRLLLGPIRLFVDDAVLAGILLAAIATAALLVWLGAHPLGAGGVGAACKA